MKNEQSLRARRTYVVLHYISVLVFMFAVSAIDSWGLTTPLLVLGIAALTLALISGLLIHVRTGFWRLLHKRAEELDERELTATRESFRRSYLVFTEIAVLLVVPIALIVNYSGWGQNPPSLLPIIFILVYIADSMPSSVFAWTEREIYRE